MPWLWIKYSLSIWSVNRICLCFFIISGQFLELIVRMSVLLGSIITSPPNHTVFWISGHFLALISFWMLHSLLRWSLSEIFGQFFIYKPFDRNGSSSPVGMIDIYTIIGQTRRNYTDTLCTACIVMIRKKNSFNSFYKILVNSCVDFILFVI